MRETYSDVRERALKSTGVNLGPEEETELTNFSMMTSFITNLQPDVRHLGKGVGEANLNARVITVVGKPRNNKNIHINVHLCITVFRELYIHYA